MTPGAASIRLLLIPLGAAIVSLVMLDALRTTLGVGRGAGPLTRRLSRRLWRWMSSRRVSHDLLRFAGVTILLVVFAAWLAGVIAGWTMVFHGSPDAVVGTTSGRPAGFWARLYFTGYTLFTLGNGEYRPGGAVWQILTVLAVLNGLFLVTLAITYFVPVASAATQKRELGGVLSALGTRPDEVLVRAWDGQRFVGLETYLSALASPLAMLAQRHLTYPVLHYFHNPDRSTAAAPSIAGLDETLTLLGNGVAADHRLPGMGMEPLREVVSQLLGTLEAAFIAPSDRPPHVPSLAGLRAAGIPTVDDDTFARAVDELAQRRRLLRAYVEDDGWTWDEVWGERERERSDPRQGR